MAGAAQNPCKSISLTPSGDSSYSAAGRAVSKHDLLSNEGVDPAMNNDEKPVTLEGIFSPRGVAVVGASEVSLTGKISFGGLVVLGLVMAGFPAVYPVNPKFEKLLDLPCYPDLLGIPGPVDHVVVTIPAEGSLDLLDQCAAKGVRSVHFFSAGFGESGEKGRADLERTMLERARAGNFRIIGPNCVGLYVPKNRLMNAPNAPLEPGPIAFISQSGGHAQTLPVFGASRGLRYSKIVSYGNALDVDECELLDYLADDPETDIIAAYFEGVRDGRRFIDSMERAARSKPLIVYKGGRTEAGKRAAFGHTASMTSSTTVFDAACRQVNAIPVDNIEELIDTLVALSFMKTVPAGPNAAVVGGGGGPSVLASDDMEIEGLRVPRLTSDVQDELKRHLPLAGSIFTNPVDTNNMVVPDVISFTLWTVGRSPDIDMIVYHLGFHPIGSWGMGRFSSPAFLDPAIEAVLGAQKEIDKPVLMVLRPPQDLEGMKEYLAVQEALVKAGLPVFLSLREMARAIRRVILWKERAKVWS